MANISDTDASKDFAHAFGDALNDFLTRRNIGQSAAARLLGIEAAKGEKRKGGARIYSYCRDSKGGYRPNPDGEIVYLACSRLDGFYFDYKGYRISAATVNGNGAKPIDKPAEQLTFEFERQFKLTGNAGIVAVKMKRPRGRIEVSISLDAKAS